MKSLIIFSIFLFFSFKLAAQTDNLDDSRIIAKVGNDKITVKEFSDRYEFSPHPRKTNSFDTALVKREYLYTLIAEKLLAQEAKSLNLDTAQDVKGVMSYMERLFTRDAYYKLEVSNKVKVTNRDIAEGLKRYSKVLLVQYLYSTDKNEINNLYNKLYLGASFDSLLLNRPEYSEQKEYRTVTFGTLDEASEDSIYNLKPGQFTLPLKEGDRWYIFKLYKITERPVFNTTQLKLKIRKIIKERKTAKRENDFLYDFLHKESVKVDKKLFFEIARVLEKQLKLKEAIYKNDPPKFYRLSEPEFDEIINSFSGETLNSPFIKFEHNPETVKEFLTQLKYNSFSVDTTDLRTVELAFNGYVKNYIQCELLVRAANKIGLENTNDVKNDRKIWDDYYLSKKLERTIYDSISISDKEAKEFFNKHRSLIIQPDEVKVEEILVDSLTDISKALKDIHNGMSFSDASKKYSILDSLKRSSGDLGYFPVTSHGEIGKAAAKMKKGEIYGPVKLPEGYALIKLLGKEKADNSGDTSYASNKDNIMELMKGIELKKRLDNYVAQLAVKYGIKINNKLFKSIPVLRINTVTLRMLGFGGKIYAFPYSPLFASWYKIYLKNNKNILP